MLRISKLTDYGTLVLTHMASEPGRVFSAADLSATLGLGAPTVSKVLKTLGRHALVTSTRGARGGYALSRAANQISVADIVDALEEQRFGLTECSANSGVCELEDDCPIRERWLGINAVVRDALQAVSLADMLAPSPTRAEAPPRTHTIELHGRTARSVIEPQDK